MRRRVAVLWHATLSLAAGVLYFFFVLPRWPELTGDTSHGLGTAARIAAGVLIALAALPVVFTLLRSRKPEFGTPALALTLLTASIVAHVLAGVLIVGTAISEIWLNLDNVGQSLFGIYGAAAAIAVLGIFVFYLSSLAELPPPPPKPLKAKKDRKQRRRGKKGGEAEAAEVCVIVALPEPLNRFQFKLMFAAPSAMPGNEMPLTFELGDVKLPLLSNVSVPVLPTGVPVSSPEGNVTA